MAAKLKTLLPKVRNPKTGKKERVATEAVTIRNLRVDLLDELRIQVAQDEDWPTIETLANEALAIGLNFLCGKRYPTYYSYDEDDEE